MEIARETYSGQCDQLEATPEQALVQDVDCLEDCRLVAHREVGPSRGLCPYLGLCFCLTCHDLWRRLENRGVPDVDPLCRHDGRHASLWCRHADVPAYPYRGHGRGLGHRDGGPPDLASPYQTDVGLLGVRVDQ